MFDTQIGPRQFNQCVYSRFKFLVSCPSMMYEGLIGAFVRDKTEKKNVRENVEGDFSAVSPERHDNHGKLSFGHVYLLSSNDRYWTENRHV